MILHVGSNGNTMVSLPRDSNVEVPSYTGSESGKKYPAKNRHTKINATYAEDGPTLLVRTVEHNTGLRIDHYAEIGFGGFAKIVDAVGGVEMDIPRDIKDKKSGADFEKGKQTLDGREALAFVRTRYALPGSDLDRTKNQQKFLAALANQAATPGTVLNPFKLYPTMGAGLDTLKVDKDMSLWNVASMFWAMKGVSGGEGTSMNMPISGSTPNGNLQWDEAKVKKLVDQLNNERREGDGDLRPLRRTTGVTAEAATPPHAGRPGSPQGAWPPSFRSAAGSPRTARRQAGGRPLSRRTDTGRRGAPPDRGRRGSPEHRPRRRPG